MGWIYRFCEVEISPPFQSEYIEHRLILIVLVSEERVGVNLLYSIDLLLL